MMARKQVDIQESSTLFTFDQSKITSGFEPDVPKNIQDEISAAHDMLSGNIQGPLIPEGHKVTKEEHEKPLLEDYDHVNLREFEDGEPGPGDQEWTRYADNKEPQMPESIIDLDTIPASNSDLLEILADLQQAEIYNFQGEVNLGKNNIKQAVRDFSHALEINPNYVDALINRGSAYILQKQYNTALIDFNLALELDDSRAEIYNVRGEVYLINNMNDQAIKDFTAAIILNPTYSDAYLNRAKAHSAKGLTEEAEYDCSQAIRTDSDKSTYSVDPADIKNILEDEFITE